MRAVDEKLGTGTKVGRSPWTESEDEEINVFDNLVLFGQSSFTVKSCFCRHKTDTYKFISLLSHAPPCTLTYLLHNFIFYTFHLEQSQYINYSFLFTFLEYSDRFLLSSISIHATQLHRYCLP